VKTLLRILGRHSLLLATMTAVGLLAALANTYFRDENHTATATVVLNKVNFELGLWQNPETSPNKISTGRAVREVTSSRSVRRALQDLLPADAHEEVFVDIGRAEGDLWGVWPAVALAAPASVNLDLRIEVENGAPRATGKSAWSWNASTSCLESSDWRIRLSPELLSLPSFELEAMPLMVAADRIRKELRARDAGSPELLEVTFTDKSPGKATAILEAILTSYAGSGRRHLEEQALELGSRIDAEKKRLEAVFQGLARTHAALMSSVAAGDTEITLEAEALRLSELDQQVTASRLLLRRLKAASSATADGIVSALEWETDIPGAIPILEQLAVVAAADDRDGMQRLQAILLDMAKAAKVRESANLEGLRSAREDAARHINDLVVVQDELKVIGAPMSGIATLLGMLTLREQQVQVTLNTMSPSITRTTETRVPTRTAQLTDIVIALLGCIAGLLIAGTLVAFLESRRQGVWTALQAEDLTGLPCMTGPVAGLASWMYGLLDSQDADGSPPQPCLLFAWSANGPRKRGLMDRSAKAFLQADAPADGPAFLACQDPLDLPAAPKPNGTGAAFLVMKRGRSDLAFVRHCEPAQEARGWPVSGSVMLP